MEHLLNNVSKTLADAYTQQFTEQFNNTQAMTNAANLRSALCFLLAEHFALLQHRILRVLLPYENGILSTEQNCHEYYKIQLDTYDFASED